MKKKKLTLFLIVAALAVWGYSGLQFAKFISDNNHGPVQAQKVIKAREYGQENYQLMIDYRDPFLNDKFRLSNPTNKNQIKPSETPSRKVKDNALISPSAHLVKEDLVNIKYRGLVRNAGNYNVMGIFSIGGRESLLTENDSLLSYKIFKLYMDSACIMAGKKKYYIQKTSK